MREIQNDTFTSSGNSTVFVPLSNTSGDPGLGMFVAFVAPHVKDQITAAYDDILGGTKPFVGLSRTGRTPSRWPGGAWITRSCSAARTGTCRA
jgi:hypothetical protein